MLNQNKQVVDIEKYLHNIRVYVNSENIENEVRRFEHKTSFLSIKTKL